MVAAWALAVCYAATDEVHQLFVSGRSGQPTDVLIDACGVLAGVAVVHLLTRPRQG
jgi:VanZ family protein